MKFTVMKMRITLAVCANCRAVGVRQDSMVRFAVNRGFFKDEKSLEIDSIAYFRRTVRSNQAAREALGWLLLVGKSEFVVPPVFTSDKQIPLAAAA